MFRWAAAIALMAVVASSGSVAAGGRAALRVGETVPKLALVDIEEARIDSEVYRSWVQVLTFADRESSEQMKAWMRDAQIRATQAHPELSVAYLGFADVSAVPRFLRGIVRPVLRRAFENSNAELEKSYRKLGIEPDPSKLAFRFIPDWDGSYLKAFGLESAATYHCWVVVDGRVVAALDATTPDIADRYVETFDRLAPDAESEELEPQGRP